MTDWLSLIGVFGFGGIIGIILQYYLNKKSEINIRLKQINEEKYRTLLIYMSIILSPENKSHFVLNDAILHNLKSEPEIKQYAQSKIKEYYYHSLLYASDDVMRDLKEFINQPTRDNYIRTAQKMRLDLWNAKTSLTEKEIG